jgi:hypothetical protein
LSLLVVVALDLVEQFLVELEQQAVEVLVAYLLALPQLMQIQFIQLP